MVGAEEGQLPPDREIDAELPLADGGLGVDGDLVVEIGEARAEVIQALGGGAVVELLAREVKAGNKVGLIVTHDERMLDLCNRVVRIEDGRLHEEATVGTGAGQLVAAP